MSGETGEPQSDACEGLAITHDGHRTRLKWHRLRRRMADPLFGAEVMAEGFRLGASMELDMRVRGDGGFVVLHDAELGGETTGAGVIAEMTREEMAGLHFRDGDRADRPLVFSEDLAGMLSQAHADALLQFDMKDDYSAIGQKGVEHLRHHFSDLPCDVIVSAGSLDLIEAVRSELPMLLRGIDPSDKLYKIHQQRGIGAVEQALLADLRGPTEPDTVYLNWRLVLAAKAEGLDLVALCHSEGKKVDAWTFTLKDPATGFSNEEWADFSALLALRCDQITTDEAPATERAYRLRLNE